jgi:hypothetical protein
MFYLVRIMVLRYIKGTTDQGGIFPRPGDKEVPRLTFFSDADMQGKIYGQWSTSGVSSSSARPRFHANR